MKVLEQEPVVSENSTDYRRKKEHLFFVLSGIFLINALLAEIIGVKIFSAGQLLGLPQTPASGDIISLQFNLSAGVIIWPVVFVLSDIFNEYFGKKGVRKVSIYACILILYSFLFIYLVTLLPPADFWLKVNEQDISGNSFNINTAFSTLFRQGMNIIVASITAFLIGQLIDASVFYQIRKMTSSKRIWLRATVSTFISQLVDSFLILFIAFYFLGKWTIAEVLNVGINHYLYKVTASIVLIPVLYLVHDLIVRYLGRKNAEQLKMEAVTNTSFESPQK